MGNCLHKWGEDKRAPDEQPTKVKILSARELIKEITKETLAIMALCRAQNSRDRVTVGHLCYGIYQVQALGSFEDKVQGFK